MSLQRIHTTFMPPKEPKPKAWICPKCGSQEPLLLPSGRWQRRGCQCERDARLAEEKKIQEQQELQHKMERTYLWMGEGYGCILDFSIDDFDPRRQQGIDRENAAKAWTACKRFIEEPVGNLVLFGEPGLGKTMLIAGILNALKLSSKYLLASEFPQALQQKRVRDEDEQELIQIPKQAKILAIDDLGKAPSTDTRESIYFDMLNYRMNRGLSTIVSTNSIATLETYIGVAGRSRLMKDAQGLCMTGVDQRKVKRG